MSSSVASKISYKWQLIRAGTIKLDGGGMFGVVPKTLWQRNFTPDDRNRITIAHNCLLLERDNVRVLIESGSGDKFEPKLVEQFGLEGDCIRAAITKKNIDPRSINHAIVTHLHFDHAGGLTSLDGSKSVPSFPNAFVHVQHREWNDAIGNNAVMTRTYLKENLDPLRDHLKLVDSPQPFESKSIPRRNDRPRTKLTERTTEVLPGIRVFLVPGHTWGQQAIMFNDEEGQTIVFTPDVMPTVGHVGAAYSIAYDVEPYTTMMTKTWFLEEAVKNNWLLALDHEPNSPLVRVQPDGKGWYTLVPENP